MPARIEKSVLELDFASLTRWTFTQTGTRKVMAALATLPRVDVRRHLGVLGFEHDSRDQPIIRLWNDSIESMEPDAQSNRSVFEGAEC